MRRSGSIIKERNIGGMKDRIHGPASESDILGLIESSRKPGNAEREYRLRNEADRRGMDEMRYDFDGEDGFQSRKRPKHKGRQRDSWRADMEWE